MNPSCSLVFRLGLLLSAALINACGGGSAPPGGSAPNISVPGPEASTPATPGPAAPSFGNMVRVDPSLIPAAAVGQSDLRVKPSPFATTVSDIGAMRVD